MSEFEIGRAFEQLESRLSRLEEQMGVGQEGDDLTPELEKVPDKVVDKIERRRDKNRELLCVLYPRTKYRGRGYYVYGNLQHFPYRIDDNADSIIFYKNNGRGKYHKFYDLSRHRIRGGYFITHVDDAPEGIRNLRGWKNEISSYLLER